METEAKSKETSPLTVNVCIVNISLHHFLCCTSVPLFVTKSPKYLSTIALLNQTPYSPKKCILPLRVLLNNCKSF